MYSTSKYTNNSIKSYCKLWKWKTLLPKVYASLAGSLALDAQGDEEATFIFKIGGAFKAAVGASIILTNGVSFDNIYWIAIGAAVLGADSNMLGTFGDFKYIVYLSATILKRFERNHVNFFKKIEDEVAGVFVKKNNRRTLKKFYFSKDFHAFK